MTLKIDIITLFPEIFKSLSYGIPGRAQKKKAIQLNLIDLRDFADNKHRQVDDKPYGGGPGMVLKAEPLFKAIQHALHHSAPNTLVSALSPQGQRFNHEAALKLSKRTSLILIVGRYEGLDERVNQRYIQEEWSLGDFILSGGELAAMCMVDAVCRLIPGVLGHDESAMNDSFHQGLLDYPHYTRPLEVQGLSVPRVLSSGHHSAIADWRRQQSLGQTWLKRPDLLEKRVLTEKEKVLLAQFINHYNAQN